MHGLFHIEWQKMKDSEMDQRQNVRNLVTDLELYHGHLTMNYLLCVLL